MITKLPIGTQVRIGASAAGSLLERPSPNTNQTRPTTIVGYGVYLSQEGYIVLNDRGWVLVDSSIAREWDQQYNGRRVFWVSLDSVEVCPQCGKTHP
jgi:hypothetical protein